VAWRTDGAGRAGTRARVHAGGGCAASGGPPGRRRAGVEESADHDPSPSRPAGGGSDPGGRGGARAALELTIVKAEGGRRLATSARCRIGGIRAAFAITSVQRPEEYREQGCLRTTKPDIRRWPIVAAAPIDRSGTRPCRREKPWIGGKHAPFFGSRRIHWRSPRPPRILRLSSVACGCSPTFRFRQRLLRRFFCVGWQPAIGAPVRWTGRRRGVSRGNMRA
jgi:hypothetical protein